MAKNRSNPSAKEKTKSVVKEIAINFFVLFIIISSVIQASRVPTPSMETTIKVGDFLLINKFLYGLSTPKYVPFTNVRLPYYQLPAFKEPQKNDIVVFEYPGDRDVLYCDSVNFYVKRLIGCPGDTVNIVNRLVYVNDKRFPIPVHVQYARNFTLPAGYTLPDMFPAGCGWNPDNYGPLIVPKKGDVIELTAGNIEKWRTLIDREQGGKPVVSVTNGVVMINGKPVDHYTIEKDYYFMLGDNRDNSEDSRFWGFVPRDKIIGTPMIIHFSWDPSVPFTEPLKLVESIRWDRLMKIPR